MVHADHLKSSFGFDRSEHVTEAVCSCGQSTWRSMIPLNDAELVKFKLVEPRSASSHLPPQLRPLERALSDPTPTTPPPQVRTNPKMIAACPRTSKGMLTEICETLGIETGGDPIGYGTKKILSRGFEELQLDATVIPKNHAKQIEFLYSQLFGE
jgi:hypothetical protein